MLECNLIERKVYHTRRLQLLAGDIRNRTRSRTRSRTRYLAKLHRWSRADDIFTSIERHENVRLLTHLFENEYEYRPFGAEYEYE
jgi:hypothetical protein